MGMDLGISYSISSGGGESSNYGFNFNTSSIRVYQTQTYRDILLKPTHLKASYKTHNYQP